MCLCRERERDKERKKENDKANEVVSLGKAYIDVLCSHFQN